MFRIVCDPSSGSMELYLTEITCSGSRCLSCAWSVFGSVILNLWCVCVRYTHTPQVQNYADKHRPSTRQTFVNHYE